MALTTDQQLAAEKLLAKRPVVLPGTRVILNDEAKKSWYAEVTQTMSDVGITGMIAIHEFCDLAGVAD